jgi:hypothetical protein
VALVGQELQPARPVVNLPARAALRPEHKAARLAVVPVDRWPVVDLEVQAALVGLVAPADSGLRPSR